MAISLRHDAAAVGSGGRGHNLPVYSCALHGECTAQPPATFTGRLTCEAGPSWQLVFEMDTYGTSTATCSPFEISIDVTGNGYGITSIVISG